MSVPFSTSQQSLGQSLRGRLRTQELTPPLAPSPPTLVPHHSTISNILLHTWLPPVWMQACGKGCRRRAGRPQPPLPPVHQLWVATHKSCDAVYGLRMAHMRCTGRPHLLHLRSGVVKGMCRGSFRFLTTCSAHP